MAELGDDFFCVTDLDFNLTEVSGRRAVAESVARRWLTFPGTLFYDPTYGFGLELWLNEPSEKLDELGPALENEALKDERVESCRVAVRYEDGEIHILARLEDGDGPFSLVLDVGQVSVQLLLEENG